MDRSESRHEVRRGLRISLDCTLSRHGRTYLASCDKLGVSDQGLSPSEAVLNLATCLKLFLKEFPEREPLEKVLNERHIQFALVDAPEGLPEISDEEPVVAEVDAVGAPSSWVARANKELRIPMPTYLWAH